MSYGSQQGDVQAVELLRQREANNGALVYVVDTRASTSMEQVIDAFATAFSWEQVGRNWHALADALTWLAGDEADKVSVIWAGADELAQRVPDVFDSTERAIRHAQVELEGVDAHRDKWEPADHCVELRVFRAV